MSRTSERESGPEIILLPARNCRRSRKIMEFLQAEGIPFKQIPLESPEGQRLAAKHGLQASPGILIGDVSVNPFQILVTPACQVDAEKVRALLDRA